MTSIAQTLSCEKLKDKSRYAVLRTQKPSVKFSMATGNMRESMK